MKKLSTLINNVREQYSEWFSRAIIIFLLIFLFFVTFGGVSHNNNWQINHVNISGNKTVSEDIVRSLVRQKLEGNYFFVYARENSYLFPKVEIEGMILEIFPRIASTSVERIDNHTIAVTISERKPYALWCGTDTEVRVRNTDTGLDNCWFIDDSGFIFDHAPVFSSGVYLEVYGALVEKNASEPLRASLPYERFIHADTFVRLLHKNVGESLRISLKAENEVEVTLRKSTQYPFLSGVGVRFNDSDVPETLIENFLSAMRIQFPDNVALKKKLLYIDMRFGNKIFFGFEN